MKNVLIVCNLFGNNRQGYDLAQVLREEGCRVRLVQYAPTSEPLVGNYGVRYIKPHGCFSKFHVLYNLFSVFYKAVSFRCDKIVCIGYSLLGISSILKLVNNASLIYYSLEYRHYKKVQQLIVRHLVDQYIDCEEIRRKKVFDDLKLEKPYYIMYNLPALSSRIPEKGHLKAFLMKKYFLTGHEKIIIYAGSYQKYACLENIISASKDFPPNVILVLMIALEIPDGLGANHEKCYFVPPQHGDVFFDWLSDADCALLPYEAPSDFNVMNCSPQKLFDCYRVGVPYLASKRPLIERVNASFSNAGRFCDFTSKDSIVKGIMSVLGLKTEEVSNKMRELYLKDYNYSRYASGLANFICC